MSIMEGTLWLVVCFCLSVDAQYNRMSKEEPQFTYMNFLKKPGQALADSLVSVSVVNDFLSCQFLCLDHTSCLSVNVGKKTNETSVKCELNNSTSVLKPTKMRKRKGFHFYGLAVSMTTNHWLTLRFNCVYIDAFPGTSYLRGLKLALSFFFLGRLIKNKS